MFPCSAACPGDKVYNSCCKTVGRSQIYVVPMILVCYEECFLFWWIFPKLISFEWTPDALKKNLVTYFYHSCKLFLSFNSFVFSSQFTFTKSSILRSIVST
jgi:hypothetical protein